MFRQQRVVFTVLLAVVTFAAGLGMTFLTNPGADAPFCPLIHANAQNSPCLAQEATISAMKNVILQNSIDNASLNATNTALKTQIAQVASGSANVAAATKTADIAGLPFTENFADNSKGWDLSQNEAGGATLTTEGLLVTIKSNASLVLPIPQLHVTEFYAEFSADLPSTGYAPGKLGFSLGNNKAYHLIWPGDPNNDDDKNIHLLEIVNGNTKNDLSIPFDGANFKSEKHLTFGLESKHGLYTTYVNGRKGPSFQTTPHGDQLGLYLQLGNAGPDGHITFTNITVRPSK